MRAVAGEAPLAKDEGSERTGTLGSRLKVGGGQSCKTSVQVLPKTRDKKGGEINSSPSKI